MADVWLVVAARSGIFGAWVGDGSEGRANDAAQAIGRVNGRGPGGGKGAV